MNKKSGFEKSVLSYINLEDFPFGKTEIKVIPEIILDKKILNSICIIQLSALGDVVQTTPVIKNFKIQNKDLKIFYITFDNYKGIIENHTLIDEIISIDYNKLISEFKLNIDNAFDYIEETISDISNVKFDLVINFHPSKFSAYLTAVLYSVYKIGLQYNNEFSDTYIKGDFYMYLRYFKYYMLEKSIYDNNNVVDLFLKSSQLSEFDRRINLSKSNITTKHIIDTSKIVIGIIFGAAWENKYYIPEYFNKVISILNGNINHKFQFVLFGAKHELIQSDIIAKKNCNIINLTGKTTLSDLPDYIDLCDYIISNDTGLMHIASAFNKKLIILLGPTNTKPIVNDAFILSANHLACKYCLKNNCNNNKKCFYLIKPEIVSEVILSLINKTPICKYDDILIETTGQNIDNKFFSTEYVNAKKDDFKECVCEMLNFYFQLVWESMNSSLYYENNYKTFEEKILYSKIAVNYNAAELIIPLMKKKFQSDIVDKSLCHLKNYIKINYVIIKEYLVNAIKISNIIYQAIKYNNYNILNNINKYLNQLDIIDNKINVDEFLKKFFNLTNVIFHNTAEIKNDYLAIARNDLNRYKIKEKQLEILANFF